MDVTRAAPQGAHYYADVICLLPKLGVKKEVSGLWYSELSLYQLDSRPTVFIPRWTTHPYILYQVCVTRGAAVVVVMARRGTDERYPYSRRPTGDGKYGHPISVRSGLGELIYRPAWR